MNKITQPLNKKYRPHQLRVIRRAVGMSEYGIFHDMGSGKTLTAIAIAQEKFKRGMIDTHIVFVQASIIPVWLTQYQEDWDKELFDIFGVSNVRSPKLAKYLQEPSDKLKVIITSSEGLSQGNSFGIFYRYIENHRCLITIDESTCIKNPKSIKTKRFNRLGQLAVARLILTGTPSTNGLHDLYAQIHFLNPDILQCRSYFVFKNKYCLMGGFEGKKIIGYYHEEELFSLMTPYVDIQKIDRKQFPPQNYQTIAVPVTAQQSKLIKELEQEYSASMDIGTITPTTALERLTRYQQILGGSFPYEAEEGQERYLVERLKKVPKLDTLIDTVNSINNQYKIIVWARFIPEVQHIAEALAKLNIGRVVTFYGKDDKRTRARNSNDLQYGDARIMVTNATGARGQTWTTANYNIYYSNSYSYELREQSERRSWGRDDSKLPVFYIDLIADSKYDKVILKAIRYKKDVSEMVMDVMQEGNCYTL